MEKHIQIIIRPEAKRAGLKRYFTGKPCKWGHIEERNTYSGMCLGCSREIDRNRYQKNPGTKKKSALEYAAQNPEKVKEFKRKYHDLQKRRNRNGPTSLEKACSTCKEKKPSDDFHKHSAMPSGLSFECRSCAKARLDDKIRANPDFYRNDYAKHRDRHRRSRKEYRNRHRERCINRCREWRAENPEKHLASVHARRARTLNAEGAHTAKDVRRIREAQRNKCATCCADLDKTGCHVDHIVPLSKGGSNWPSNLQMLCPPCNLRKSAKDPQEWAQENGKLL